MKSALLLISTWILSVTALLHINNESEFFSTISQELVLVKFFVPECEHCIQLAPEYEKATTLLSSEPVLLSQVNCLENKALCSRYFIKSYPTLQLFRNGKASIVYTEERTAEKMTEFMKKQLLPRIPFIETEKELQQLKDQEPILIVGYFSKDDQDAIEAWNAFGTTWLDDFAFALVTDKELAKSENISSVPSFALYKHFDQGKETSAIKSQEDMLDFIRLYSLPLLDTITPNNFLNYVEAARPLVYLFSDQLDTKQELDRDFLPLAQTLKEHFSFVHINATEYPAQAEFLSLNETRLPALGVHNFKTGARYPWNGDWEMEHIKDFLVGIMENRIDPMVKSQAYPVKSDTIQVVVGKEFNQVVFDTEKDVIIQIYAPWCSHSQKLAPIWEQVAQNTKDIVVAKMDGTVNDVPPSAGFQVKEYPTIKLIKAKTNEIIDYSGDRTLEDILQFLHTHTRTIRHEEL
ncbi:unnamed protein product [Rhizopus stolonifer]